MKNVDEATVSAGVLDGHAGDLLLHGTPSEAEPLSISVRMATVIGAALTLAATIAESHEAQLSLMQLDQDDEDSNRVRKSTLLFAAVAGDAYAEGSAVGKDDSDDAVLALEDALRDRVPRIEATLAELNAVRREFINAAQANMLAAVQASLASRTADFASFDSRLN